MSSLDSLLERMKREPQSIRFSELLKVCEKFFGRPRFAKGSHILFKTPWPGDPRINIQNDRGKAKQYQVLQVLAAIEKLKGTL